MNNNNDEVEAFFKHLAEHDTFQLAVDTAFDDGMAKGRIEGKIEGKIERKMETAQALLQKGFDVQTIVDITGLTEQVVLQLHGKS